MLSVVKPLQEFGKLDKCLSRYGTRFEFNNEKQVIFSSNVNSEDTFVILEGVISLRREGNCTGYHLPAKQTITLIEQNQLWRDAFYWLAWQNRILELRDVQLIGHNSYEQIRATLLSMIDWNEELRSRIGVMNYIHQRTRISRSVVAEVLAALRKGGYIEMNKGKLVAINRLPSEY
ncbi:TPA: helix-turn-helix domain-containing protein [Escherichia coli]|nr:helix-turn-helix domain-containing protein [Escherichia coli]